MNARERFLGICGFNQVDRPPYAESMGFWDATIKRWEGEGLPKGVTPQEYFEMDRVEYLMDRFVQFYPPLAEEIVEDTGEYTVVRDTHGVLKKERKDDYQLSMPQFLKFPVENRGDFEDIKWRLDPSSKGRYPDGEGLKSKYGVRDYPLVLIISGAYGFPRELIGEEKLALMFYDDPGLIRDIEEQWLKLYTGICDRIFSELEVDGILIWEDMAYKNGPLISPSFFREFMLPYYKKLIGHIRSYGVRNFTVDSDGNSGSLLPLFTEGGANVFLPIEVAAGMDPVKIRKEYGNKLALRGGIDKRVLAKNKKGIEKEIMSKVPWLLKSGGYIPMIDHACPPDVSFENYRFYVETLRNLYR